MKRRKSTIPTHLQIPVALGLSIVFIIVLAWRFWPRNTTTMADATDATPAPVQQVEAQAIRLRGLVHDLAPMRRQRAPVVEPLAPLGHNPFSLAAWEQNESGLPDMEQPAEYLPPPEPTAEELVARERARRISNVILTGTLRQGHFAMAIVNDRYVKPGDEINNFKVVSIHEDHIVLRDGAGPVSIPIMSSPLFGQTSMPDWQERPDAETEE